MGSLAFLFPIEEVVTLKLCPVFTSCRADDFYKESLVRQSLELLWVKYRFTTVVFIHHSGEENRWWLC